MTTVALYARVSTARQEQEETIESQIAAIKERIVRDGHQLDENHIYKDEGYSGSILDRPRLDELKESAKTKAFDLVYVYDYGRISRDLTNLMLLKDSIEKDGIKVISLHEHITGEEMSDRLMIQMMGAFHEYERKKIAQRFHNGKIQKAKRGEIVGYNAPYGYRYDKETGLFEIETSEAEVVKKMFEWVANEGLSTYALIRKLHEECIKPPKQKSDYWTRSPIARILKNETYYGRHFYNKSEAILPRYRLNETKYRRTQKTGRRIRDRKEWIEAEVPAIITQDLFDKAREQISRNKKFNPKNRKHNYLLTGLIKCTCGANRNGDGPEGKKYYRCISRHQHFDCKNRCDVGGLNVVVTDALVWREISKFLSSPDLLREKAEAWLEKNQNSSSDKGIKKLERQIHKLRLEQTRYTEAYGKGILPESIFEERMQDTAKQIERTNNQIKKLDKNTSLTGKIDLDTFVEKATVKLKEFDFKSRKAIVERVVDKIIASPKEITIWGHLPVPALATATGKVNHVPQYRDSWPTQRRQVDVVQCTNQEQCSSRQLSICHHRAKHRNCPGPRLSLR